jgi:hypothetical protein
MATQHWLSKFVRVRVYDHMIQKSPNMRLETDFGPARGARSPGLLSLCVRRTNIDPVMFIPPWILRRDCRSPDGKGSAEPKQNKARPF